MTKKAYKKDLTKDERRDLKAYTGGDYKPINRIERGMSREEYINSRMHDLSAFPKSFQESMTEEQFHEYFSDEYDRYSAMARNVNSALGKMTVKEDIRLYRGHGSIKGLADQMGMSVPQLVEQAQSGGLVGKTLHQKGAISTAIDRAYASKTQVQMIIDTPKGSKGMYMEPKTRHKQEYEFLLQGNHNLRITGIDSAGHDRITLHVRYE